MANVVPRYRQRNPRHGPREGAGQAKAYTVNEESRYILVRNIPALGATEELLQRLGEFGRVERHRLDDDHDDASEYIDVLWVQFDTVTASRRAKALAVKNPFYGSVLQISYLPQDEQPADTRSKLDERRKLLQDRIGRLCGRVSHSQKAQAMAQSDKRRNWSWEEDKVLLIQAAMDRPFGAEKGQLTKAWQAMADTMMSCDHFTRVVDGRKVQNRFSALVEEHRRFDKASARLSGTDEEEKEKHILLDDVVALLDDARDVASQKTSNNVVEKEKAEQGALLVRDMAMRTMKRRNENDPDELKKKPALDNRRNSLAAAIEAESERELAVREKELLFQQFKLESEIKQRELDREERKAEREHQILLARIDNEKMLGMFKAIAESKK
ncbi:hypothetical protein DYB32_005937 [Aphanomyces invadans]|uniref:RRM domain-containing protein n=1 Tax=Aphanomyces invadans TaxID=157072 RepID=A0A3R6VK84_9STRA|nr:hypothetical protein DYB32_005937 [Aphanomyces invadans]